MGGGREEAEQPLCLLKVLGSQSDGTFHLVPATESPPRKPSSESFMLLLFLPWIALLGLRVVLARLVLFGL